MHLEVLGCCGGYPEANSACSGYLVEADGSRLWLDAGSGTLARLLARCSLADIDAVWLTHLHPDHWTDLPLAVHALAIGAAERSEPLPIYGPRGWAEAIGATLAWRDDRSERTFEELALEDGSMIGIGPFTVQVAAVEHGVEAYAFRVEVAGATLAYSGDSVPCDALIQIASRSDVFLCAAGTMGTSLIHSNPEQAGEMAAVAGAKRLLLTHLPPGADREFAIRAARERFGSGAQLAAEGSEYDVRRGTGGDRSPRAT